MLFVRHQRRKLNLIYHIYPRATPMLSYNLGRLLERINVFNNKIIITIVDGVGLIPVERVVAYLASRIKTSAEVQYLRVPDTGGEREPFFDYSLPQVVSLEPSEHTFYAHAKGVSPQHDTNPLAGLWVKLLYDHNLNFFDRGFLYTSAGCFRHHKNTPEEVTDWHFSGTFFWFRHDKVFNRKWQQRGTSRFAVEAWLGKFVPYDETYCYFGDTIRALVNPRMARKVPNFASLLDESKREIAYFSGELNKI